MKKKMKKEPTHWSKQSRWYEKIVGSKGHYYQKNIIFPKLLEAMQLNKQVEASLLDLACGEGVLSRHIPSDTFYYGIDHSKQLIEHAEKKKKSNTHFFDIHDLSLPISLKKKDFTFATIILALQNISSPYTLLRNVKKHLKNQAKLFIVLNHPCFRIPQHSHWHIDTSHFQQSRLVDRYLSCLKIPILTHPSQGKKSPQSISFHRPLSYYTQALKKTGFVIENMEEWVSDKTSEGKYAKMENTARNEFPLFLLICAKLEKI